MLALLCIAYSQLAAAPAAVHVAGLSAPVAIWRDRWDVPHIWAADEHDLFAAQGYLAAHDRLWQMLLRRQAARGRLSEWLGDSAAEADALLAAQKFYSGNQDELPALEAYAAGVNAYLASGARPIELILLARRGVSVEPETWTAQDSLAIARMMDWAQTLAAPDVQLDSDLIGQVGAERAADLNRARIYPALPTSTVGRQILHLAAIPLQDEPALSPGYSTPTLPPAWHIVTLHSPAYQAGGAALAGLPGVVSGRSTERAWSMVWSPQTLAAGRADAPCARCIALQDVRQLDANDSSAYARHLLPYLIALEPQGWLQKRVTLMLTKWDYRLQASSASAAVYEAWLAALSRRTFADELGTDLYARWAAGGGAPATLIRLARQPDNVWWDDLATPQRETRDDMMRLAYANALDYLGRHYGDLHTIWEWGQVHAARFEHALGDRWPESSLLNRGPIFLGGDGFSQPATPFDPAASFEAVLTPSLVWQIGPGGKLAFALAGEQAALVQLPGRGQLDAWRAGQFTPLLWDKAQVQANASGMATLLP